MPELGSLGFVRGRSEMSVPTGNAVIQKFMANDPLALVEYWSIDPDFDGVTFRSKWQDYRENTENDSDPLRVIHKTKILAPHKNKRKICVKAVDKN